MFLKTEQLLEDTPMLATNMQKWYMTAQTQGIELGMQKGKLEGVIQVARNLLDVLDDATIAMKTGLTIDEVKSLKKDQRKV